MLGVVIPARNGWADTKECIESLLKSTLEHKIVLVDGGSTDNTQNAGRHYPVIIHVKVPWRVSFSAAVNIGIRYFDWRPPFDKILLLNNDTVVTEDTLERMSEQFFENIGVVTPRINYYESKQVWSAGGTANLALGLTYHENIRSKEAGLSNFVDWGTGCALMIKRDCWERAGEFDENLPWYDSDVDYCLRARQKGFTVWYTNKAVLEHKVGRSSSSLWQIKEKLRGRYLLLRKYLKVWQLPLALFGFLIQSLIRYIKWLVR